MIAQPVTAVSVYIINSKRQRYSRPEFYSLSPHFKYGTCGEPAYPAFSGDGVAVDQPSAGQVKPKFKTLTNTSQLKPTPSVASDRQ